MAEEAKTAPSPKVSAQKSKEELAAELEGLNDKQRQRVLRRRARANMSAADRYADKRRRHLVSMFGEAKGAKLFEAEKKAGFKPKGMFPYTLAGK